MMHFPERAPARLEQTMRFLFTPAILAALTAVIGPAAVQEPPSFTRDIHPFLKKHCLECHNGKNAKAEFDVTSYATIKKGGISFPGFIPGNPKESFMLELVEQRSSPVMPPKKSKQPTAAEKKMLRDWIAAGAKDDGAGSK
jgi:hypothetical protein